MRTRGRDGFTLIEMMVAMALTLLVITILSQAFVMALNTFSVLKGLGDLQQELRTAATVLRADLASNHFEGDRRLSDPNICQADSAPQAGFFVVKHGSAVLGPKFPRGPALYWNEGTDANNLPSYMATDHFLYFTVRRIGNRPENFFTTCLQADAGTLGKFFAQATAYGVKPAHLTNNTLTPMYQGGTTAYYASQWAEVFYFLVLNPVDAWAAQNDPAGTPTPTFSLYRAQFVMVPDSTLINARAKISNAYDPQTSMAFAGMACNAAGATLAFTAPIDAASGQRTIPVAPLTLTRPFYDPSNGLPPQPANWPSAQWPPTPLPARLKNGAATTSLSCSTLLLSNVVSFEVAIMRKNAKLGIDDLNFYTSGTAPLGSQPNLTKAGTSGILYDTTLFAATVPAATYSNRYSLKAIQVTLRTWNSAARQTRQCSVVQGL